MILCKKGKFNTDIPKAAQNQVHLRCGVQNKNTPKDKNAADTGLSVMVRDG